MWEGGGMGEVKLILITNIGGTGYGLGFILQLSIIYFFFWQCDLQIRYNDRLKNIIFFTYSNKCPLFNEEKEVIKYSGRVQNNILWYRAQPIEFFTNY